MHPYLSSGAAMTLPFPSEEPQDLAQLLNWATPQMPTSGATLPTGVPPLRAASNQDGIRTSLSSQAYYPHPCPGFCQWTSRMYLETHFPQSSEEHIQHSLFILFRGGGGALLLAPITLSKPLLPLYVMAASKNAYCTFYQGMRC